MSKNKFGRQESQGSQFSKGSQFSTKVTEQAGCGKVISETFTPNDPTISCTKCGAESHDPSLLCSPSTSSMQSNESSSSFNSGYSKDSGSSRGGSGSSGMTSGFGSSSGGKQGGQKNR